MLRRRSDDHERECNNRYRERAKLRKTMTFFTERNGAIARNVRDDALAKARTEERNCTKIAFERMRERMFETFVVGIIEQRCEFVTIRLVHYGQRGTQREPYLFAAERTNVPL